MSSPPDSNLSCFAARAQMARYAASLPEHISRTYVSMLGACERTTTDSALTLITRSEGRTHAGRGDICSQQYCNIVTLCSLSWSGRRFAQPILLGVRKASLRSEQYSSESLSVWGRQCSASTLPCMDAHIPCTGVGEETYVHNSIATSSHSAYSRGVAGALLNRSSSESGRLLCAQNSILARASLILGGNARPPHSIFRNWV